MTSSINSTLPIPATIKEITPDWVKKITGHDAVPDEFHLEGDIQAGVGFISSICRVSFKTTTGDKHSVVVKLLPPMDSPWMKYALADLSDEREIKVYSIVLPDLIEIIPELRENVGLYYNGAVIPADSAINRERASMLVMEDLKASGYEMMNFSGDGSEQVLKSLVTFLARFHFAALAIEVKKGIPLPQLYPFMQGINKKLPYTSDEELIDESYTSFEKLLPTYNVSKETLDRYLKLKPFTKTIAEKLEEYGRKTPCMVHGDLWPPNLQIHKGNLPVKMLDWQMLGYRDVTFDLAWMLYTVLPMGDLTTKNLRRWLRCYYDQFEKLCNERREYGDKIKRRSYDDLETFFFTWGATFMFLNAFIGYDCQEKDHGKYANIYRVLCEENNLPEFLLSFCT